MRLNKSDVDLRFLMDMIKGSVSNLKFQKNGFIKAGVGLAISPIYYSAVSLFGGSAYSAAQAP